MKSEFFQAGVLSNSCQTSPGFRTGCHPAGNRCAVKLGKQRLLFAEFRVLFGTGQSGHAKADHQSLYSPGDTFRNLRHFFISWRSRRRHRLHSRFLMKKMLDRAFGAQLGSGWDRNKRALGESGSFSEAFRDSLLMRASSKNNRLRMAQQYPMRSSFMSDVLSPGVSQAGTQPIRSIAQILIRGMESFVVIRAIFSVSGKMVGITNAPVSLKTTRVFATQKIYSGTLSNIYINKKMVFAIETGVYASSTTVSVALTKVFAALTSSYVAFTSIFVAFTSVYIALSPIYVPLSSIYIVLSSIYVALSSIYVVFTMVKDDCQARDIAWV